MTRAEFFTVTIVAAAVLGAFVWDSGILQAAFGALRPLAASTFRRAMRMPWRKPAVPAAVATAGAATSLLGEPVLGDRMISDVRAHADAMNEISTRYVPLHDQTLPRLTTSDHAPWDTSSFPAVDEAEEERVEWVRSQLETCAEPTTGAMRGIIAGLRAMDTEAAS